MSVLEVVNYGDPILRKKCQPVSDFSKLPSFVEDMFDTMYEEEGIGLAANQVGADINLFIIDIAHTDEKEFPRIFINGEITKSYGESVFSEGCLSIPGQFAEIERPAECTLKYIDYNGKEKELKADGLLATCIQHEVDHLNGILFIDYLSKLKKDMIIKKLVKKKKEIERIIV